MRRIWPDLLRMGRLPEAWIAPPQTRELRGWVRHRAKLVGLRSSLKNQVHAVLAAAGVYVPMSDLFGAGGQQLLAATRLAVESRSRIDSLLRMITALDFEIDTFGRLVTQRLRGDPGYTAIIDRLRDGAIVSPTATDRMYRRVLDLTGADPLPYGLDPNRARTAGALRGGPADPHASRGPGGRLRRRHARPDRVNPVRIAIAADHNGVALKAQLVSVLRERGHDVTDLGTHRDDEVVDCNNDSNVLVLGAKVVAPALAEQIAVTWLETPFKGGVHQRRLDQIAALERGEPLPG